MKHNILVIEDQRLIGLYLKKVIESQIIANVLNASNGEEGFSIAIAYPPDLIILDLLMPIMDGCETLLALRDNLVTSQIPVIMLLSRPEELRGQMKARQRQEWPEYFLSKPIDSSELLHAIRTALEPKNTLKCADTGKTANAK